MSLVDKLPISITLNENQARYNIFLDEAKVKILSVRAGIAKAACKQQMELYTWIGSKILEYQEKYNWGNSAVEKLSYDLTKEFPTSIYGFSPRNLRNMKNFYVEYKDYPSLQEFASQIPWGHNLIIMSKVKNMRAREFYLKSTHDMIWTRDFLILQINNQAYEHQILDDKQHNFSRTLPDNLALQADQAMKDIYIFETLGLSKPVVEAEMESRMVSKIKDVMLEFGCGFALKNRIDVEYSLRDINKPVGVSEFTLTKKLPKELLDKLPDPKDLERQIRLELGERV